MRIARLERLADARQVWRDENSFSDWLITDAGLGLLAEELGVEIEDADRESTQGDFKADIVGHAVGNEEHVILV